MQSARLLFRASLLHLPIFLILYLVHRIPNDGRLDWAALWRQLSGDAEAMEARMCRAPLGLPSLNGAMIFPFSPPIVMDAPPHDSTGTRHALRSVGVPQVSLVPTVNEQLDAVVIVPTPDAR